MDYYNYNSYFSINKNLIYNNKLIIYFNVLSNNYDINNKINKDFMDKLLQISNCKNTNIEYLPLNRKTKDLPPVLFFIMKNWDNPNLEFLIWKKLINKEKDSEVKYKLIEKYNENGKKLYYNYLDI